MNYYIISDTHGHLEKAYKMFEQLSEMTPDGEPFDAVIHCGDYQRDADSIEDYLGIPMISVPGNCDGARSRDFQIVFAPGHNILVSHGHAEGIDYGSERLAYLAREQGCDIACFGHTHVPVFREEAGIIFLNPGSLTYPRDGSRGSCAILHVDDAGGIFGKIYYYEDFFGSDEPKRNRGGYLRGLLNYSDRF